MRAVEEKMFVTQGKRFDKTAGCPRSRNGIDLVDGYIADPWPGRIMARILFKALWLLDVRKV